MQGGNCYAEKNDSYNRISRFRGALLVRRLRRFRGDQFLETRIIPGGSNIGSSRKSAGVSGAFEASAPW